MRAEYDALVDDDLILACVDDFCRLTVRHRVKKVAGGGVGGAYGDNAAGAGSAAYAALRQAGGGSAGAERLCMCLSCVSTSAHLVSCRKLDSRSVMNKGLQTSSPGFKVHVS